VKLFLRVAYIGTAYAGFQVQKNCVTIQEKLQDAIESLYGKRYPLTGCSRTDSGVHARDFCCTVECGDDHGKIPVFRLPEAMNRFLPKDIAVFSASEASDSFHPRYDVESKEYEYLIFNSKVRSPFYDNLAYVYGYPLDERKMNELGAFICGKQDFKAFMSAGSDIEDTVRTVKYCIAERDGDIVKIRIAADGFLYNMVRIIVGTLIEASLGRLEMSIPEIIASQERKNAGFTAPACGLYLNKVEYRDGSL